MADISPAIDSGSPIFAGWPPITPYPESERDSRGVQIPDFPDTAAGDHIYSLFHSYAAIGSFTPDGTPWTHDFDGKVIITPGTLVALAGSVASVALYATTLVWEEVDRA